MQVAAARVNQRATVQFSPREPHSRIFDRWRACSPLVCKHFVTRRQATSIIAPTRLKPPVCNLHRNAQWPCRGGACNRAEPALAASAGNHTSIPIRLSGTLRRLHKTSPGCRSNDDNHSQLYRCDPRDTEPYAPRIGADRRRDWQATSHVRGLLRHHLSLPRRYRMLPPSKPYLPHGGQALALLTSAEPA